MKFYLETLGCPKNVVDSEMMGELLRQAGHQQVDEARAADLLVVNTCGFIALAREESLEALHELASHKKRGQFLVAAGCMAQRHAETIRAEIPQIDAVLGTRAWPEIVDLVAQLAAKRFAPDLVRAESQLVASITRHAEMGASAYLKIADGCDAACAFCAIPLIKGPQQSKPRADILREARELADEGVQELLLIAQDTTAYGRDLGQSDALPGLLRDIASAAPEIGWLRMLYAYPQHITPALIETMAELNQVCHYLDLPLQHGHPNVLKRMNRPHDIVSVYGLLERFRRAMPDVALRTTFIVGFPGETEREFHALLDFMGTIRFDQVGVFAYSSEEGTAAAGMPHQVPAEVIAERYEQAMLLQQEISLAKNQAWIGQETTVLVDGVGDGVSIGRNYRQAPEIDGMVVVLGELPVGQFAQVKVVDAQPYDLIATPPTD